MIVSLAAEEINRYWRPDLFVHMVIMNDSIATIAFLQKVACFTSSCDCSLPSGSGIFESGNFLLKLQSGKFEPRENNLLYGSIKAKFLWKQQTNRI